MVLTLSFDERIKELRGGSYIGFCMMAGSAVMVLLTFILLLYTNSFLMKQRTREFGLYYVLGMEKRHVGKILWYETLFSDSISLILGLVFGTVFYKLCSLLICRLLQAEIIYGFDYIKPLGFIVPALLFMLPELLIWRKRFRNYYKDMCNIFG